MECRQNGGIHQEDERLLQVQKEGTRIGVNKIGKCIGLVAES